MSWKDVTENARKAVDNISKQNRSGGSSPSSVKRSSGSFSTVMQNGANQNYTPMPGYSGSFTSDTSRPYHDEESESNDDQLDAILPGLRRNIQKGLGPDAVKQGLGADALTEGLGSDAMKQGFGSDAVKQGLWNASGGPSGFMRDSKAGSDYADMLEATRQGYGYDRNKVFLDMTDNNPFNTAYANSLEAYSKAPGSDMPGTSSGDDFGIHPFSYDLYTLSLLARAANGLGEGSWASEASIPIEYSSGWDRGKVDRTSLDLEFGGDPEARRQEARAMNEAIWNWYADSEEDPSKMVDAYREYMEDLGLETSKPSEKKQETLDNQVWVPEHVDTDAIDNAGEEIPGNLGIVPGHTEEAPGNEPVIQMPVSGPNSPAAQAEAQAAAEAAAASDAIGFGTGNGGDYVAAEALNNVMDYGSGPLTLSGMELAEDDYAGRAGARFLRSNEDLWNKYGDNWGLFQLYGTEEEWQRALMDPSLAPYFSYIFNNQDFWLEGVDPNKGNYGYDDIDWAKVWEYANSGALDVSDYGALDELQKMFLYGSSMGAAHSYNYSLLHPGLNGTEAALISPDDMQISYANAEIWPKQQELANMYSDIVGIGDQVDYDKFLEYLDTMALQGMLLDYVNPAESSKIDAYGAYEPLSTAELNKYQELYGKPSRFGYTAPEGSDLLTDYGYLPEYWVSDWGYATPDQYSLYKQKPKSYMGDIVNYAYNNALTDPDALALGYYLLS